MDGLREWLFRNMVQGELRQPEGDTWMYPPMTASGSLSYPSYAPMGMSQMMLRDMLMSGAVPQTVLQEDPLMGQNPVPSQMPPVQNPGYDPLIDDYPSNKPKYYGR